MKTATTVTHRPTTDTAFGRFLRTFQARLRQALELSAAPYIELGSARLF